MGPPAIAAVNADAVAAPRALAGIAAVAARLAAREPEHDQLVAVVDAARAAVNADECVLWSFSPGGLEKLASPGHQGTKPDEVSALLAADLAEANGIIVRPLLTDEPQPLGVISIPPVERAQRRRPSRSCASSRTCSCHGCPTPNGRDSSRSRWRCARGRMTSSAVSLSESLTRYPSGSTSSTANSACRRGIESARPACRACRVEEAIGKSIFEILHRQPADSLRKEFDEVIRTGRIQTVHMESTASGDARTFPHLRRSRCGSPTRGLPT